ncbi:MAG: methyltransferase domain-containing protein [Planctomycetota bacterium]
MDEPGLNASEHRQALRGLARLNWASNASGSLWRAVRSLVAELPGSEPIRVLDIASGGGDIARGLAKCARQAGINLKVHGLDFSATAVEHANRAANTDPSVTFGQADVLSAALPTCYDIVTSSLFLHHLSEPRAIELLRKMTEAARVGVAISDLRRSWTGYALASVACRVLSRSPVVAIDGPRSVEGAFTIEEFRSLAAEAGIESFKVARAWPQRFIATWHA